jgi:hypothetical protein
VPGTIQENVLKRLARGWSDLLQVLWLRKTLDERPSVGKNGTFRHGIDVDFLRELPARD